MAINTRVPGGPINCGVDINKFLSKMFMVLRVDKKPGKTEIDHVDCVCILAYPNAKITWFDVNMQVT